MTDSPFPRIVDSKQRAFLAAFRETGNVRLACEVAKVGRSSHYRWLGMHPEYREAFELAKLQAADVLEDEAHRRAVLSRRQHGEGVLACSYSSEQMVRQQGEVDVGE